MLSCEKKKENLDSLPRSGDPQCKSWGDELYTHNNENLYSR